MKQEVKLSDIRAIKMGIAYKAIKQPSVDDESDGELVTVLTIETVLNPAEIGDVAKLVQHPEVVTVLLESKQSKMEGT